MKTEKTPNKRRKWIIAAGAVIAISVYIYWAMNVHGWWREEVRLSNNSIVEIRRRWETNTPLFPVDQLLVWDRIQIGSTEGEVPEWRGHYVMALVVDREISTGAWYVIATTLSYPQPLSREQRGYDAPYVEYRLSNGQWGVYAVSENNWNRKTNVLVGNRLGEYADSAVPADKKFELNWKATGTRKYFRIYRVTKNSAASYDPNEDKQLDQGVTK